MDPLTIALQAAPLIYKAFAGKKRGQDDLQRSQQAINAAQAAEQEALGRREYQVGDSWNKYLAASKQDRAADLQRDIASQQEASTLGALQSGGAKALLGGLQGAQSQSAQQRMQIEADSQARQQAALGQYAGVQQRIADANVGLASMDVQRQQQLRDDERKYLEDARQRQRESQDQLVTGGIGLAAQLYGATTGAPTYSTGGKNKFKEIREFYKKGSLIPGTGGTRRVPVNVETRQEIKTGYGGREKRARLRENRIEKRKAIHDALKDASPQAYERRLERADAAFEAGSEILRKAQTGRSEEPFTYNRKTGDVEQEGQKYTLEEFMRMSQGLGGGTGGSGGFGSSGIELVKDSSGNPVKNAQGQKQYRDTATGETRFYKAGGVQKTPGEFSHAKNPIDIMKDGAKIGEMTGGEYIFNPRQASTLQSLASKGGSPLHKYVRNLLNEFDKR